MHASLQRFIELVLIILLGLASPQMSAGKINDESIDGLSGVTFDHGVVSDQEDVDDDLSTMDLGFGLCIPQDRLEDVDFSPKFDDDWIRLDDLAFEEAHKDKNHDSLKVACGGQDGGEIESNVAANSLGEEQADSREKSLNFENSRSCDFAEDERQSLNSGSCSDYAQEEDERKLPFLDKKRRANQWRKGNRNGKRGRAVNWDSRERKKCTHCQAEDTLLWRLGPLGRNTLCNACGLRFKVGRLVENYRPAASPCFDSAKHSNFYKRLMQSKQ